ncbi:hypothetical protein GW17_00029999 [Ensete ventricosum]|nr:hypothetical protein GW17_00029999 [Ensete ventricosum]RZR94438.1 hypothetical protein BHM03_00023126 [Ensete ventricosum]
MSCLHPSRTGGSSYVAVPQLRCFPHPARGPPAPAWACGSRKLSTVPGIIRKLCFGPPSHGSYGPQTPPHRHVSARHFPPLPPLRLVVYPCCLPLCLAPTRLCSCGGGGQRVQSSGRSGKRRKGMGRNGTVRRSYSASSADYRLLEEVGYGASATVYRAIYLPTKEIVAVKRLDLDRCNSNFVSPSLTVSFVSGDSSRCCGGVGWGCE